MGRPSTIYRLAADVGCSIGVHFESSFCQLIAIDAAGSEILKRELPLTLSDRPVEHASEILQQLPAAVEEFIADGSIRHRRVLAVGVTPPGMVDTFHGVWLQSLRLSGIEHVELSALLEQKLLRPVLLEDGARCLTHLAVSRLGPHNVRNLFLLSLSSGVGSGMVVNGHLYHGERGLAGEVGHLVVEEHGERCPCGKAGCLETVASLPNLLRRFRRRLEEGVISNLHAQSGPGNELTLEAIEGAAEKGDRLTLGMLSEVGRFIGDACSVSIMMLGPRTLCIAGPVAALWKYIRDPLWNRVRQQVIPEMLTDLQLEFSPYQPFDKARGAAQLATRWFWDLAAGRSTFKTTIPQHVILEGVGDVLNVQHNGL